MLLGENNLATIVERIMAQNGVNIGLQRKIIHLLYYNICYKLECQGGGKSLSSLSLLVIQMSLSSSRLPDI